jgi:hypothetical protein
MAKKKSESVTDVAKAFESDVNFKKYGGNAEFFKFEEGEEIRGILISLRDHELPDRRAKVKGTMKMVRVYSIRMEDGSTVKLAGRATLDRTFDDIMDENGGYAVENKRYSGVGYEWLQNRAIILNRGDDGETSDGNVLGTYEVRVEEGD